MAPRRTTVIEDDTSPIDETMKGDVQTVADQLAEVLEGFQGIDQGQIKGMLFKIPKTGGKFEYIREILPPFNMGEIMDDMRDSWGGGDYRLSLFVSGKLKKQIPFSVVTKPNAVTPLMTDKRGDTDLFALMMAQQNASRQDMMQMMTALNTSQQQSSDRMMQMMTVLIPAMMGGREKTSELLTAFAMMNPKSEGGGMKETLEVLTVAKGLFGDGGGGGDGEGDLVSNVLKLAGPAVSSLASLIPKREANAQPVTQGGPITHALPAPVPQPPPGGNMGSPLMVPGSLASPAENSPGAGAEPTAFPILDMVREDVLFMFKRGRSPEMAAEYVLGVLDDAGVTDEQIFALVAQFQSLGAGWLDALAEQGRLDLRSNPEWAFSFLGALVSLYSQDDGEAGDTGGGTGGESDPGDHGETRAGGLPIPNSSGES